MSKLCECCGKKISISDAYYRTDSSLNIKLCICDACSIQYDVLASKSNTDNFKSAISWAKYIVSSQTSTTYAKNVLSSMTNNAEKILSSKTKCDICGRDVPAQYAKLNRYKQHYYNVCSVCDVSIFCLKNRTDKNSMNRTIEKIQHHINNRESNPEKEVALRELISDSQNYIDYNETYYGKSNSSQQSNKPWYITKLPILLMITEGLLGAFFGGLIGFSVTHGIIGILTGAAIGASLYSLIGNISIGLGRMEENLNKDIQELKNQNKELSDKIVLLYNEIKNKDNHTN